MRNKLTGYHVTAMLVAFFAVVIGVNLIMARHASRTFGGALADNGYVASQDYNRWIASSEAQERLGWKIATRVEDGALLLDTAGVKGATVEVIAEHPLGRIDDQPIEMIALGSTSYRSAADLPPGRWKLRLQLRKGGDVARYLAEVRA